MTRVSGITSNLLRPPPGLSSAALEGRVAPVAPLVRRFPSAAPEPTVPGVARRTSSAASMAPRAAAGLLAGPEGFARHGRLPPQFHAQGRPAPRGRPPMARRSGVRARQRRHCWRRAPVRCCTGNRSPPETHRCGAGQPSPGLPRDFQARTHHVRVECHVHVGRTGHETVVRPGQHGRAGGIDHVVAVRMEAGETCAHGRRLGRVQGLQPRVPRHHLPAVGRAAEPGRFRAAMRRAERDHAMHPADARLAAGAQPGPDRKAAHAVADHERRPSRGFGHPPHGRVDGGSVIVDRTEGRLQRHGHERMAAAAQQREPGHPEAAVAQESMHQHDPARRRGGAGHRGWRQPVRHGRMAKGLPPSEHPARPPGFRPPGTQHTPRRRGRYRIAPVGTQHDQELQSQPETGSHQPEGGAGQRPGG